MRDLEKRIDVDIKLLTRKKWKIRAAEKGAVIAMLNTSHFYTPLYSSLFGGRTARPLESEVLRLMDGSRRDFKPDVVKKDKHGVGYTEIKGISLKAGSPHCPQNQVANYAYRLLARIEKGDKKPFVDYSFFRYGNSQTNVHFEKLENGKLISTLCKGTRDLLIAPLNLAFLLFLNGRRDTMDQTSNDSTWNERVYWKPFGKHLTMLHKEPGAKYDLLANIPPHIKRKFDGGEEEIKELLALEELFVEKYVSPPKVYVDGVKLKPFNVAHYKNHDYSKWLESFSKNHEVILTKLLGIRDVYNEEKGAKSNSTF